MTSKCLVSGPDCCTPPPHPPPTVPPPTGRQQLIRGGLYRGRRMGRVIKGQPRPSLGFLPGTDGMPGPRRLQSHPWPAPSHQTPARCSPRKEGGVVVSTGPCAALQAGQAGDAGVNKSNVPSEREGHSSSLTDGRSPPPKSPHCVSGQLTFSSLPSR